MRPTPSFSIRIRSYLARTPDDSPTYTAPIQRRVQAAYYRGGTSRAVIIQPQHLPRERAKWPSVFRQLMGSGDPYGRQLDGMGAGISSLSKICLVEPHGNRFVGAEQALRFQRGFAFTDAAEANVQAAKSEEEMQQAEEVQEVHKADIDYTFVGLGIESDEVDVAGNCGNMSSAIGPYAYNAGLLSVGIYTQGDGEVTVKIWNTNTGKLIDTTFEVVSGQAMAMGDYSIDGVTGPGSKIKLDFMYPFGSKTGKVLPTGKIIDHIEGYRTTCVDGANPAVFIRADDIGVDGAILPDDFNKLPAKLDLLERIRKVAAVAMGIAPSEDKVPRTIPKIGIVSQSSSHDVLSGRTLLASQMDVVVRFLSDTQPHRAIPLTAALTTAVAARIPGTIVEQMLSPDPVMKDAIAIGHASGRLQVNATMNKKGGVVPISATVYRTAKRLFEGYAFCSQIEEDDEFGHFYGAGGRHSLGLAFVLESRGQDSSHLFTEEDEERDINDDAKHQQEADEILEAHVDQQLSQSKGQHRRLLGLDYVKSTSSQPVHAPTKLTEALQQLQVRITDLLSDPDLTSRQYSDTLVKTLQSYHQKIVTNSNARVQPTRVKEWHKRAKEAHIRKVADKKEKKVREKMKLRTERLLRNEEYLDKDGNLGRQWRKKRDKDAVEVSEATVHK